MTPAKTRVLALGINYVPEQTGIAPYTASLMRGLVAHGCDVRVLTAHPHYPAWDIAPGYGSWTHDESLDGVKVRRLRHYVPRRPRGVWRMMSELSFGLRQALTRWGDPDAIISVSPALFATMVCRLRARITHPHTPFVVWVQDLYGMGLAESQLTSRRLTDVVLGVERWVLRSADRVVVIHDRFAERLEADFGIHPARIDVVRNWTHIDPPRNVDVAATRSALKWPPDETIVLHAGSMGAKQGLEHVVEAARLAAQRGDPVRFVLLGDGAVRQDLEERAAGLPTVTFMDLLDDDAFAAALASADILLVNHKAGVSEMSVPSKLTSYFTASRPVIAAADADSVTACEVRAAGDGVVVPAEDPWALLHAALEIAASPKRARRMGKAGLAYVHAVLDEDHAIESFLGVLRRLQKAPAKSPRTSAAPARMEIKVTP
ncbi:WcaI family glycosyltransferase [Microbacterium hominis]|uniref:D-inositol 3-phosphate glycosyltransferase n=1 Tax=Microbacterium hominis TaxID=162426 RepID=A0A7D4UGX3_9MICO|nr:WcaI family glycosyltransferase [Microbacterium hominis]QKJ20269.1 WcaI family glycosyltransferase [Microbacterium hominis]